MFSSIRILIIRIVDILFNTSFSALHVSKTLKRGTFAASPSLRNSGSKILALPAFDAWKINARQDGGGKKGHNGCLEPQPDLDQSPSRIWVKSSL